MLSKYTLVIICCFLFFEKAKGITSGVACNAVIQDSARDFLELQSAEQLPPRNAIFNRIREKIKDNKKLIAAVLAFPLPLGIVGAHRIYLGSKPYIPMVYIATIGGCFGILPLIDFIVILVTKKENLGKLENNNKVFMWTD